MIYFKQYFMVFDSLIDLLIDEHSTAVASHAIVFVSLMLLCHIIPVI